MLVDNGNDLIGLGIEFLAVEAHGPPSLRTFAFEVCFNVIDWWNTAAPTVYIIKLPRMDEVGINARVLAFTVTISLACAVLSSLFPAWKLSHSDPIEALRENSQNTTAGRGRNRFQNILVIVQTGLGVMLLIASGLLIRGFLNVRQAKTGFNPDHLLCFLLPLTPVHYPDA